jgi:AsmA protein
VKYLKYGLYALVAIVVVMGGVFAYIAATFDPNAYKDDIVDLVKEETGRTLSIDGDIRLTFFPKIGVGLGPTRLSELDAETEFAGVEDLRVALALFPLLSRQIVVDEVVVDGLRARVIKYADGSMNIDDLAGSEDSDETSEDASDADSDDAPGQEAGVPMQLDVQGVRINNGAFSFRDEQAGTTLEITELSLETGRVAAGVPTPFEYSVVVRADQPALDLRTRASGILHADIEAQRFKVTAFEASTEGVADTVRDLQLGVSATDVEAQPAAQRTSVNGLSMEASGVLEEDRFSLVLTVPALQIEENAVTVEQLAASLTGVFAGARLTQGDVALPKLAMQLENQHIDLQGLSVRVAAEQAQNTLMATLDAPQLVVTPESASGAAIVVAVQARGPELRADAGIRVSGAEGSARALRISEIAIDIDAQQGENAIKGRTTTPLDADLEKQRFRLSKIAGNYAVRSPALPMASTEIPLNARVDADLKGETVKVDLKTRFDESKIEGVFDLAGLAEPFYRFNVSIDRLDLDRYTSAEQQPAEESGGQTPSSGEEGAEAGIDLSPLKALNLDGTVRIGQLQASNVKLSKVRVTVKAADGKLNIDPLLANLYGGTIRSAISADANTNEFALKQSLSGVTIGPLLQDALDQDLLDGRGSVDLDLTAQGDTVGALIKTLTGTGGIALKDGAIKGINLAQSLRGAKDMLSLKRDQEMAAAPTEKTDFSELKASFEIDKGQARNEDLSLSSPFVRLDGAGSVNLVDRSIDYVANTSLVATSTGQGGKDLSDVAGFTVPVRVSGPLTALKYELQFSDAIEQQAKQRLKAEEKRLKKKVESELTEKLLGGATGDEASGAKPGAPAEKPEDVLKDSLKSLFR